MYLCPLCLNFLTRDCILHAKCSFQWRNNILCQEMCSIWWIGTACEIDFIITLKNTLEQAFFWAPLGFFTLPLEFRCIEFLRKFSSFFLKNWVFSFRLYNKKFQYIEFLRKFGSFLGKNGWVFEISWVFSVWVFFKMLKKSLDSKWCSQSWF